MDIEFKSSIKNELNEARLKMGTHAELAGLKGSVEDILFMNDWTRQVAE